ncbi:anti-sigma factor domain-containing protein [Lysobacter sp. HA18]
MREHDIDRDPPSDDLLAGEYVLGVLDERTRREVRLRIARDPAFARLVEDWSARLDRLNDELPPATVPDHAWPRIRTRLGWSPVTGGRERAGAGFWKAATAAGFAAAAVLAVVAVQKPRVINVPVQSVASQAKPVMPELPVTQLMTNSGQIAYLATPDPHGGGMWLVPVPGTVPEGQMAPVLWLIAPGQKPKSLGYVGASHSHWVDVPKAELHAGMQSGWTVAITMEPVQPVAPQSPSSKPMAAGTLSL